MPRRIEIELTSARDDGTWTWRAAGAREPRGTVPATLVGDAAKVGAVLKVEAEFFLDGIEITAIVPTKGPRQEAERLELLGSGRADEPLVTTTLARPERGERRDRRDRGERGDRGDRGDRRPGRGERSGGDRGSARGGERSGADRPEGRGAGERRDRDGRDQRRSRPPRPEAPPVPVVERPKAKRLRPGKAHRTALLESLVEEQRPIAEQVVLGGLPAVRQAIEKQNAERTAAGEAAIAAGPLLELAEKLVPKVRAAEWRDRAEAAKRDLEVVDLRDLRSVVSAADSIARDDESRTLARELREGLTARVDAEHTAWLEELTATVGVGRIVRALRLSSRPPKAGAPLPADLATKLIEQAGAALTADAAPERWVAVLDALAFAPVRDRVIPASLPENLHDDVKATIARLATRIPKIAHIFEVDPDPSAPRPERRRPPKPKKPAAEKSGTKPKRDADPGKAAPAAADDAEAATETATNTADAPAEPDGAAPTAIESGETEPGDTEDAVAATAAAQDETPRPGAEDARPDEGATADPAPPTDDAPSEDAAAGSATEEPAAEAPAVEAPAVEADSQPADEASDTPQPGLEDAAPVDADAPDQS
jgi:hypothetical protein